MFSEFDPAASGSTALVISYYSLIRQDSSTSLEESSLTFLGLPDSVPAYSLHIYGLVRLRKWTLLVQREKGAPFLSKVNILMLFMNSLL